MTVLDYEEKQEFSLKRYSLLQWNSDYMFCTYAEQKEILIKHQQKSTNLTQSNRKIHSKDIVSQIGNRRSVISRTKAQHGF